MIRRHQARSIVLALLASIATGCGEEVVVRTVTRVEREGGAFRRAEIVGAAEDGSKPRSADWIAEEAHVLLARRDAWARVEELPGKLAVEGFFPSARELPPLLAHRTDRGIVADGGSASLSVEDLVVIERRVWRESVSDPFGPAEVAAALDGILAIVRQALESELHRTFGNDLDVAPVGRFLAQKVRPLAVDLLPAIRRWKSGAAEPPTAGKGWREILAAHAVKWTGTGDDLLARPTLEALSEWMRRGVAGAISKRERPIDAAQLTFWPEGEQAEAELGAIAQRVFGGTDEPAERIAAAAEALAGYYGELGGPRFRFETRLTLPGRLLRTNGTADPGGVVWFHRDADLIDGDRIFEAESVELRDEALRSLGARRELDTSRLLQLTDLLTRRDPDGALRGVLATAVARSRLGVLRDEAAVPEPIRPVARELADLLDPAVEAATVP